MNEFEIFLEVINTLRFNNYQLKVSPDFDSYHNFHIWTGYREGLEIWEKDGEVINLEYKNDKIVMSKKEFYIYHIKLFRDSKFNFLL
jgi:hypothetical protein